VNINVALGERSYDVILAPGARHFLDELIHQKAPLAKACVIITSPELRAQKWFDFTTSLPTSVIEVPEGETSKTFSVLHEVCEQLALAQLSRDDVVVGVGGGAITDLAGFAAATYLRGISVVHVPTSLVGQVDAAIGGKTAINLRAGKNLVGSFHQPLGVLCDVETLTSLPDREHRAGLGEVAKCWLLEGRSADDVANTSLEELIAMSVSLKARIVSADEREGSMRALLNYGHTLAHALEALTLRRNSDELRHGEAVAIGLGFAARLAHALERVDASFVKWHDDVLNQFSLNMKIPNSLETLDLVEAMGHDKKAHHDLTFVLGGDNGFELVSGVDPDVVRDVIMSFRGGQ
jgi:5-deoxy-5-amino-3-dehydroquinate synthase